MYPHKIILPISIVIGNFILIQFFSTTYYLVYFLVLILSYTLVSYIKFDNFFVGLYIVLVIFFTQIIELLNEQIYDMKIYLDIEFSFYMVDSFILYSLSFMHLLLFISTRFVNFKILSKNLGYNVLKK